MLRMPVCNKRPIVAVIDTAAEVTIMSDKIFQALRNKPPILRKMVMYAEGRGMQMDTIVVGPGDLQINNKMYSIDVSVAPIDNDMLLGLDFLAEHGTHIDLRTNTFSIGQDQVPMYYGFEYHIPMVAKLTEPHRAVIPANLGNYIVESSQESPA